MLVKKSLGIVWMGDDGYHVESIGIYLYGYFGPKRPTVDIEALNSLWSSLAADSKVDLIESEEGNVFTCDVRLHVWPSDSKWTNAIKDSLRTIIMAGGSVAWCGGEDCTWSPTVLDPTSMAGNVYAGYAESVGFLCNAPMLTDECVYLSDAELLSLHRLLCED